MCLVCLVSHLSWLLFQDPDWRQRLQNLDAVFGNSTARVTNVNPDADLSDPNAVGQQPPPDPSSASAADASADHLSEEEFKKKYPVVAATISTAFVGVNCYYTNDAVYIMSQHALKVAGAADGGTAAKPLFMYAGGSWISDSGKDTLLKLAIAKSQLV